MNTRLHLVSDRSERGRPRPPAGASSGEPPTPRKRSQAGERSGAPRPALPLSHPAVAAAAGRPALRISRRRRTARELRRFLAEERGAVTAEYAIVIMAAVAFAGLLVAILRSDEIRAMLVELVENALGAGG